MDVYSNLKNLGIELLDATPKGGIYSPVRKFSDKLLYLSGVGSANAVQQNITGKMGDTLTVEEGQEAARRCMINILSNLHHYLGDLNQIKSFVKILAFVAGDNTFYQQPQVVDGASKLLEAVFGNEIGMPARSAIGVNALPGNIPVEIEAVVELL